MFQLTEMTQATIASVTPRVEKHGDDDKPAVSIKLQPGASRAARTERGYRKTREALEKGAAEHAAAGAK